MRSNNLSEKQQRYGRALHIGFCQLTLVLVASCKTLQPPTDARLDLVFQNPSEEIYTEYFITENGKPARMPLPPLFNPKITVDIATMADYGGYTILYSPTRRNIVLVEDSGASEVRHVLFQKRGNKWETYHLEFPGWEMPWQQRVVSITDDTATVSHSGQSSTKHSLESLKRKKRQPGTR